MQFIRRAVFIMILARLSSAMRLKMQTRVLPQLLQHPSQFFVFSNSFKLQPIIQRHNSRLYSSSQPSLHVNSLSSTSDIGHRVDFFQEMKEGVELKFGEYKLIASQSQIEMSFTKVQDLSLSHVGQKVWIRGRIASVRAKGNACFIVIRSGSMYTVQACHFKDKNQADASKALIKFVSSLSLESIVDIYGEVRAADVKACSQNTVEIGIERIFTVSKAPVTLPFLLEDAARSQSDIDASQETERPFAGVSQDVRLNNRWLDLRVPANNAILRVRSGVTQLFREALLSEQFVEIHTPKLISGESEGGSEVFRTDYFGKPACLAQSPQLYKQMAISADLDRVFEIGPVFRAEKSLTRRHLCEFTGLDLEMAIDGHYMETLRGKKR